MKIIKLNNKKVLVISDTHGKHRMLKIPYDLDIIIHCGDICDDGNKDQIKDFFDWYSALKISNKIYIHGNHDLPFELEPDENKHLIPRDIHWLNDKAITIDNITLLGLNLCSFDIQNHQKIDIVLSHYPPFGILDNDYGSKEIAKHIQLLKPKYHVFGHNHDDTGELKRKDTTYINASNYNDVWQRENQ